MIDRGREMEAIQVLAGVVASVLAFDVVISVMAACEHRGGLEWV